MEEELKEKLTPLGLVYQELSGVSLEKIHGLFCLGQPGLEPESGMEYLYFGAYSCFMKKDYGLMKKYYLQAIERGNLHAYVNLAIYYRDIEKNTPLFKDYLIQGEEHGEKNCAYLLCHHYQFNEMNISQMEKYYKKAINQDHGMAMHELGFYYQKMEKNYKQMITCYLGAIKLGITLSLHQLGYYYHMIEKDYDLMKLYYLQAVEAGVIQSMQCLAEYYERVEKNKELALKYYLMSIERGNIHSMISLTMYYRDQPDLASKYLQMALEKDRSDAINIMYNFGQRFQHKEVNILLMTEYYHLAAAQKHSPSIMALADYYKNDPENTRAAFEFGITYQRYELIKKNYQPEYVHCLLRARRGILIKSLSEEKNQYVDELLNRLRGSPTWFHSQVCVKDVIGIIRACLVA